jgi:hypothetical protein
MAAGECANRHGAGIGLDAPRANPGHGSDERCSANYNPVIRAPASYRVAVLAAPRAAISDAQHPRTWYSSQAQITRPFCHV